LPVADQRVVPGVEEPGLGAELSGGALGLLSPQRLDLLQPFALAPGLRGLAALAVGQADDDGALAACGGGGDRAARPPDEVARVGAHHEERRGNSGHALSPWIGIVGGARTAAGGHAHSGATAPANHRSRALSTIMSAKV